MRNLEISIEDGNIKSQITTVKGATDLAKGLTEAKLREFQRQKLLNSKPQVLPPAIRYISPDNTWLIWEQPPTYKTINYTPAKQHNLVADGNPKHVFRIPIPWQEYLVFYNSDYVISDLYMLFRPSPLGTGNLAWAGFKAPLNNFYITNKICQAVYTNIPEANNLYQLLNNVHEMVWGSGFNDDLLDAIKGSLFTYNSGAKYYSYWQGLTIEDVVNAMHPKIYNDLIESAAQIASTMSGHIKAVEFIMDLQDAAQS